MKYAKMLGIAAVAALALMAVVGAGTASAVSLCSNNESTCASPLASGTSISAALRKNTNATLTSNLGNVVCTKSTVGGENTAVSGNPLPGTIKTLTFSSCTLGSTSCTVTVEGLPYTAQVTSTGAGNGEMKATGQAHVDCGSTLNCIFRKGVSLAVTGGNPAIAKAEESLELIKNEGFICPSTATWDAEYSVSSPSPLFISANP